VRTPQERFWAKVDKSGECWEWTASLSRGYGKFYLRGKYANAHRVSYEWLVGPVPDGLVLDHLCRNQACVRPEHLEPVTHMENCQRGLQGAYLKARTHCPDGHAYTAENTRRRRGTGQRSCKACEAKWRRRAKQRRLGLVEFHESGQCVQVPAS